MRIIRDQDNSFRRILALVVIRYAYVMRKPSTPAVPTMRQFTVKTLLIELVIRACRKMHGI
jgi:hypothetical protein